MPPFGGIAPSDTFGTGTPFSIVVVIEAKLPSPHNHLPLVRSGPTAPFASDPWHPPQVPPASSPRKIREPSATCSAVAPAGVGNTPVSSFISGVTTEAGAACRGAVIAPEYVTRQIRPFISSEM